jgi:hypothetical protein
VVSDALQGSKEPLLYAAEAKSSEVTNSSILVPLVASFLGREKLFADLLNNGKRTASKYTIITLLPFFNKTCLHF